MIVELLNSGPAWALITVAALALLLARTARLERQGVADIRARAHVRLGEHEALPYDREVRP